jgi:hypothetical protein
VLTKVVGVVIAVGGALTKVVGVLAWRDLRRHGKAVPSARASIRSLLFRGKSKVQIPKDWQLQTENSSQ